MRLSAKAEYACLAMLELAARHQFGQPVQVKAIADTHGISARFLIQILLQLKATNLVASTRGAAGGYLLARAPQTITLADVIHSVDPLPQGRSALEEVRRSPVTHALGEVWQELAEAERRVLRNLTLADLVAQVQRQDASSYQI